MGLFFQDHSYRRSVYYMEITKIFYFKSSQIIIIKAKNKKGFQFAHLLVILLKVLNNVIKEKRHKKFKD